MDNPADSRQLVFQELLTLLQDDRWKSFDGFESYTDYRLRAADLLHVLTHNLLWHLPYELYLQTRWWQEQRRRALQASGYRCQLCNAKGTVLDVHHRTYERRGREEPGDLIVLCRTCHDHFHSLRGSQPQEPADQEQ